MTIPPPCAAVPAGVAVSDEAVPRSAPGRTATREPLDRWEDYELLAAQARARFAGRFALRRFDHRHPVRLQAETPRRLRGEYAVPVAYSEWGNPRHPTLVCLGGVANTAMRFNYLAAELSEQRGFHVVCMDWVGRGSSGWLAEESHYGLQTGVEQLRQLICHLGKRRVTLLGSSLGGSVAIEFAAAHPRSVERIILNDVGPHIPAARRRRRAQTLARHYVFRTPQELMRRIGASQKDDGPVSAAARLHNMAWMTRWSEADGGRVYLHDPRAMQAFRRDARQSLKQWQQWRCIDCPVLLIHGLQSEVLLPSIIARLRRGHDVLVAHVPLTGHTPGLSDSNQIVCIGLWLQRDAQLAGEFCIPYARPSPG